MLYAAGQQRGGWRSDGGGATWESVSDGSLGADEAVAALAFAPGAAAGVYALSTDGVSLLADGKPWPGRANGLPEPGTAVFNDLAVAPTHPTGLSAPTTPSLPRRGSVSSPRNCRPTCRSHWAPPPSRPCKWRPATRFSPMAVIGYRRT